MIYQLHTAYEYEGGETFLLDFEDRPFRCVEAVVTYCNGDLEEDPYPVTEIEFAVPSVTLYSHAGPTPWAEVLSPLGFFEFEKKVVRTAHEHLQKFESIKPESAIFDLFLQDELEEILETFHRQEAQRQAGLDDSEPEEPQDEREEILETISEMDPYTVGIDDEVNIFLPLFEEQVKARRAPPESD